MISRQLIDLINSGDALAIVGSGVSIEAGVPSWPRLFSDMARAFQGAGFDTTKAEDLANQRLLPEAFQALANLTSREDIHERTRKMVAQVVTPGQHHLRITDWPFKFFITTNYDCLLERARPDLVPVGNRGNELFKMHGGAKDVVWHAHGATDLDADRSQIVVARDDYSDFYPNSNAQGLLHTLATAHRCVFIGFGFEDPDLIRVLEAVGRLSHSGRPSYAYLGYENMADYEKHREHLLKRFNVEVIPYQIVGGDHRALHRLMDGYNPFIVRRSLAVGRLAKATPQYDPLAASLRVQAQLDLSGISDKRADLRTKLIAARLLAFVRQHPETTEAAIYNGCQIPNVPSAELQSAFKSLRHDGAISGSSKFSISTAYAETSAIAQAQAEVLQQKFMASLQTRIGSVALSADERERVVQVAADFLGGLCSKQGIGVAQNLATTNQNQINLRATSLIQGLPDKLVSCASREEALATVSLCVDLLTHPSATESEFLGLQTQAYFGQHLVGASNLIANVDLELVSENCYILDASVLICLVAEGGESHQFTKDLLKDLVLSGAVLATTDFFVQEVLEHLRWSVRLVAAHGENSPQVIDALRGRGVYRSNEFLRGYFFGQSLDGSFEGYISRILSSRIGKDVTGREVIAELDRRGIHVLKFQDWGGFRDELFALRDEVQEAIRQRRLAIGTYKHDRQTLAEAEVAVVVDKIRSGELVAPVRKTKDAFFVSSTRVVDQLPMLNRRISLLPEGLAQWLWSSQNISTKHAGYVFDQILWELAQSGVQFVDQKTLLSRFSGVVEAARTELTSAIADRREYLLETYGPDPNRAFADADPLDLPRLANEAHAEILNAMERKLATSQSAVGAAQATARISQKEREELARLRAERDERQRKAGHKKRSAKSKKKKKKKKK
jgi:hypothetical protein